MEKSLNVICVKKPAKQPLLTIFSRLPSVTCLLWPKAQSSLPLLVFSPTFYPLFWVNPHWVLPHACTMHINKLLHFSCESVFGQVHLQSPSQEPRKVEGKNPLPNNGFHIIGEKTWGWKTTFHMKQWKVQVETEHLGGQPLGLITYFLLAIWWLLPSAHIELFWSPGVS